DHRARRRQRPARRRLPLRRARRGPARPPPVGRFQDHEDFTVLGETVKSSRSWRAGGLGGGWGRLAGVEVADVRTGATRFVPCDTVVFTGDWIPDHELARLAGLAMDPGTRGPVVDTRLETSAPGVFAAGNLVHAAE